MRRSIHFCLLNAQMSLPRRSVNYHNTSMKDGVSRSQSPCLSVASLFVCLSLSSAPCCRQTRQAVPNKRAQGGLLWQQLLWCAALSVFLSLPLSVRVCVSPARAGQTGPVRMEPAPLVSFVVALGVFPIGAWSAQYHATSSHSCSLEVAFSLFSSLSCSVFKTRSPFPATECASLSASLALHAVSLICYSSCAFLRAVFFSPTVPRCLFTFVILHPFELS